MARADLTRRVAFPALLLVLALFCVEGLQLLSSVVRQDLTSPPLVDVPPIDLGSAPVPARPTAVGGIVFDAPGTADPVEPAAATVETTVPVVVDAGAPAPAPLDPEVVAPVAVAAGDPVAPEAEPAAFESADGDLEATSETRKKKVRDTSGRSGAEPGPPPGRPVGPECDAVPGRRAVCDRRPPTG